METFVAKGVTLGWGGGIESRIKGVFRKTGLGRLDFRPGERRLVTVQWEQRLQWGTYDEFMSQLPLVYSKHKTIEKKVTGRKDCVVN